MLKGIDMVVYQALKRILGTAEVAALVDDEEYRLDQQESIPEMIEWRKERIQYNPNLPEPKITQAEQDILDDKLAIGSAPRPAVTFWYGHYDKQLDAADVGAQYGPGWETDRTKFYPRKDVNWLNGPPNSEVSKELAVAFITVSIQACYTANRGTDVSLQYGNEPEINGYYTSAVIVGKVGKSSPVNTKSGSAGGEKEDKY
jgi:hypothetical protein